MTEDDINAMDTRRKAAADTMRRVYLCKKISLVLDEDMPALIAEVRRLHAVIEQMQVG